MEGLKAMIRERLNTSPLLARALEERPELQDDPAGLLQHLEERGLVEDLFASLESSLQQQRGPPPGVAAATAAAAAEAALEAEPGKALLAGPRASPWQLCLRLHEGRAFLDYLDERDAAGRELQWHISFGRQRLRCRPVPAAVDPRFDEVLFLDLPALASRAALLAHAAPVHLVLTCRGGGAAAQEEPWNAGPGSILCSYLLEWRPCLAVLGPMKLTLELRGVGRRYQLDVGVLHAELELRPIGAASALVTESAAGAHVRSEEQRRAETMRHVFEDLDRWWVEYHELYLARHIRLFAQTESCLFLPVTCFVTPLHAGRALDSPRHALRWTSLIAPEPKAKSEGNEPRWHSFPALWARGQGSVEEKSLLLCSLLLGYSLDAWCCLGTDAGGQPHAWVVVRDQGDASKPAEVTCWDTRAATQIPVSDARYLATYTSIDTVFNHRRLLICHVGTAARASFDFSDPRCWLVVPLEEQALEVLRLYPATRQAPFADLRPRAWGLPVEAEAIEEAIEERLAASVRAHREAAGLKTFFDGHLAELLHVALGNCEAERLGGALPGSQALFEGIIRRACATGELFRAVPVQFNHLRVSLFWPALSERLAVRELLASPAAAAFALRARVVAYPEGAVACWVLLAARGRL